MKDLQKVYIIVRISDSEQFPACEAPFHDLLGHLQYREAPLLRSSPKMSIRPRIHLLNTAFC